MKKTVLAVDDDLDVTEQTRLILESGGYKPVIANNVTQAWEILDREPVDLVILDVMMEKNSDGFNFAQKMRANDKTKPIPIIMATSVNQKMPFSFDKDSDGSFLPVEVFMEKPIDPAELLAEIHKLLADE